jgi:hypothetical protein
MRRMPSSTGRAVVGDASCVVVEGVASPPSLHAANVSDTANATAVDTRRERTGSDGTGPSVEGGGEPGADGRGSRLTCLTRPAGTCLAALRAV